MIEFSIFYIFADLKSRVYPSQANKHVQTHDSIILHDTCLENNPACSLQ